jgi:hypothetical protein
MKNLRVVGNPAEIQNEYVPNMSIGGYGHANPLDAVMVGDANGKQTSVI